MIIHDYYEKCVYFWFMYSDAEISQAETAYKSLNT